MLDLNLSKWNRFTYNIGLFVFSLAFVTYCSYEVYSYGWNFAKLDMLLISGIAAFLIGVLLSHRISNKFEQTLNRLFYRDILKISKKQLNEFKLFINKNILNWCFIFSLSFSLLILFSFLSAFANNFSSSTLVLTIIEMFGALIAGFYVGQIVFYGQLGRLFAENKICFKVVPGHIDGAGGLKPIGEFYLFQAMVASIPAIFLAVWLILIPIWPKDYSRWESSYIVLLIVSIIVEVLAFIMPLLLFHQEMKRQKNEYLKVADELSIKINHLKSRISTNLNYSEKELIKTNIDEMTEYYWAIEKMPTWPVDNTTRRLFSYENVLLLLPLVGKWLSLSDQTKSLLDFFARSFH